MTLSRAFHGSGTPSRTLHLQFPIVNKPQQALMPLPAFRSCAWRQAIAKPFALRAHGIAAVDRTKICAPSSRGCSGSGPGRPAQQGSGSRQELRPCRSLRPQSGRDGWSGGQEAVSAEDWDLPEAESEPDELDLFPRPVSSGAGWRRPIFGGLTKAAVERGQLFACAKFIMLHCRRATLNLLCRVHWH